MFIIALHIKVPRVHNQRFQHFYNRTFPKSAAMDKCFELIKQNVAVHDKSRQPWKVKDTIGRACPGISRIIKRSSDAEIVRLVKRLGTVYRSAYVGGHKLKRLSSTDPKLKHRAKPSWISRGDAVHQHLAHQLQCVPRNRCLCAVRCGGQRMSLQTPLPSGDEGKMIRAGMQLVYDSKLVPLGCELAITSTEHQVAMGTRIDGLFYSLSAQGPVLVSWKTCGQEKPQDLVQMMMELRMLAGKPQIQCVQAHLIYMRVYNQHPDCVVHVVSLDREGCLKAAQPF